MAKILSFCDLEAWKQSHKLVLFVYKISEQFPAIEKFGLTNQIRRAAVSITSNIAEGFSRNSSKEKVQFYFMALGSLTEVQNQLIIAKDLGYVNSTNFDLAVETLVVCSKLINGLIKSARVMDKR